MEVGSVYLTDKGREIVYIGPLEFNVVKKEDNILKKYFEKIDTEIIYDINSDEFFNLNSMKLVKYLTKEVERIDLYKSKYKFDNLRAIDINSIYIELTTKAKKTIFEYDSPNKIKFIQNRYDLDRESFEGFIKSENETLRLREIEDSYEDKIQSYDKYGHYTRYKMESISLQITMEEDMHTHQKKI